MDGELPVIPILLRPNLLIKIHGIGHDFCQKDADKLCRIIQSFVNLESPTKDKPHD
jgi:hypothetical protein